MDRDQVRARRAFSFIREGGPQGDFLALARKLPVMFQTNGLLATWAHLLAKKKPEHPAALKVLVCHFQELKLLSPEGDLQPAAVFDGWVHATTGLNGPKLRERTAEAIEFSVWLKRAAEALCDSGTPVPGGETVQ